MTKRTLSVAAVLLLGCSGAVTGGDTRSLSRYTDKLLTAASAPTGGATCSMFGFTREGYCSVTRTAAEVQKLVDGTSLAIVEDPGPFPYGHGQFSCANVVDFGRPNGPNRFELLPGAKRFVPTGAPLPPNQNNVKLNAIVVAPNGTDVCFEYQFPYG